MQTTYLYDEVPRCVSRFTGKERDTETGLDYFGARYYGSSLGRFMSPDWSETPSPIPHATLLDPRTLNLYSYVRNNPLKYADDDGHKDSVKYSEMASCGTDSCLLYQKKTETKDIKDENGNVTGQTTTETITYATYSMGGDLPRFTGGSQTTNTSVQDKNGKTISNQYGETERVNSESTVLGRWRTLSRRSVPSLRMQRN
jgi:RHS repeat-associated protein